VAIVQATLDPPPERLGVTHWSTRLLGAHLGVSNYTVAKAWQRWGLKPWRRQTFKFSTDPELEAKIRDVKTANQLLPHATGGQRTSITRH
jgi:hypothetical protein